jgi:hypothetical protein
MGWTCKSLRLKVKKRRWRKVEKNTKIARRYTTIAKFNKAIKN